MNIWLMFNCHACLLFTGGYVVILPVGSKSLSFGIKSHGVF